MKRILFVDDEQRILDGLRNTFRRNRKTWDMHFALGGEEACARLDAEHFDVVVSDMRMPKIDGLAVLNYAREARPDAARIVLSGYMDEQAALRTAAVAHQFLTKPCEPQRIEAAIERVCKLRDRVTDPRLRRLVVGTDVLPLWPRLSEQLTSVIDRADATIAEVVAVLAQDVGLSAKVLQMVNTSLFSSGSRVTTLEAAAEQLGIATLKSTVQAIEALAAATRSPTDLEISSHRDGYVAAHLARALLSSKGDEAFIAGLLHDVGRVLIASALPEEHGRILRRVTEDGLPLSVAEMEAIGSTHAELGACLIDMWGLPFDTAEAVAQHHDAPTRTGALDLAGATYIAATLAAELNDESARGTSELDLAYVTSLGLADALPKLRAYARELARSNDTLPPASRIFAAA